MVHLLGTLKMIDEIVSLTIVALLMALGRYVRHGVISGRRLPIGTFSLFIIP